MSNNEYTFADDEDWEPNDAEVDLMSKLRGQKHKALEKAICDKYTQYYKRIIDEGNFELLPMYAQKELKKLSKIKHIADNITDVKQGKNPYCFFTVNCRPEYDNKMEEIDSVMRDFTKCTYLKNSPAFAYAIEQRSEDSDTKGVHVHILFDKNKNSPSKLQRAFKEKFFDKYVGTAAALDYKYVKTYEEKLKYICGIKEKSKMPKVEQDRILRNELGIDHVFTQGFETQINNLITEYELPFEKFKIDTV